MTRAVANPVDIYLVGHFAKDKIVVDGRAESAVGGGVYYGSLALRRMGLQVAVATRLHRDDFPLTDELAAEGIHVVAAAGPATSGIENTYDSTDMERRTCRPLGFAGPFSAEDIPPMETRATLIAPIIAGEVDASLVKTLAARSPLGLDAQGFVRVREEDRLIFRPWKDMAETLAHITYLKTDRAEAELLTSEIDLSAAAKKLAAFGPKEVIITQSSGLTVFADNRIHKAPFTPRRLDGRTGRGDTCFCTYVGRRLTHPPDEATAFAAAVTTVKQETPGAWDGDMDKVHNLMAGRR